MNMRTTVKDDDLASRAESVAEIIRGQIHFMAFGKGGGAQFASCMRSSEGRWRTNGRSRLRRGNPPVQ